VLVAAVTVLGASCGTGSNASRDPDRVAVVAAENFYGDIVSQLGGSYVDVTSILSDPQADPHLYEPGTANAAAVADARLVIENGLGYDAFIDRLLAAAPSGDRKVVKVSDVLHISEAGANPHIWYDVPKVPAIAAAITDALIAVGPSHRAYFQGRLSAFDASLEPLDDAVAAIRSSFAGAPVAYTEPVPGYLLAAAGLTVRTPAAFAIAIEEGNEPPPSVVAAMEALCSGHQVRVLLYNNQASSPITDRVRQLAQIAGIPVVAMTETLPAGMTFQGWQLGQVMALATALAR
jgi:zinc/manganese transport system substrate-binding protein